MERPRVLLVDDNEEFLEATEQRLELRDIEVHTAADGEKAVALVQQQIFDVVVLDLSMPGIDGLEALRRIKAVQPYVQAVMLTGHGNIQAALQSGRDDAAEFLEKPIDIETMAKIIEKAHDTKHALLKEAYLDELADLNSSAATPREIIARTRELRAKYEM